MVVETPVDSGLRAELTEVQDELLAANQTVAGQLDTIADLTTQRDAVLAELDELAGQLDTAAALIDQKDADLTTTTSDFLRLREEIASQNAEPSAKVERIGTFPDGAWVTQHPPQGSERVGSVIRMEIHSSEPPEEFARREFRWRVEECTYGPRAATKNRFTHSWLLELEFAGLLYSTKCGFDDM